MRTVSKYLERWHLQMTVMVCNHHWTFARVLPAQHAVEFKILICGVVLIHTSRYFLIILL